MKIFPFPFQNLLPMLQRLEKSAVLGHTCLEEILREIAFQLKWFLLIRVRKFWYILFPRKTAASSVLMSLITWTIFLYWRTCMSFQNKFLKYLNGFQAILKIWLPQIILAFISESELKTSAFFSCRFPSNGIFTECFLQWVKLILNPEMSKEIMRWHHLRRCPDGLLSTKGLIWLDRPPTTSYLL